MNGAQTDNSFKTFTATAVAIPQYTRVMIDSNGLISAQTVHTAKNCIGVTQEYIAASGSGTVKLLNAPGSFNLLVGSSVAAKGAKLYQYAAGTVTPYYTASTLATGFIAIETGVTGAAIECLKYGGNMGTL